MPTDARSEFHSDHYLRHNQRRQEHLATLGLELSGKSVLEVGAGIGDHSSFFLDRGCSMVITETRQENLQIIKERYPDQRVESLDLNKPNSLADEVFQIVYCYGTLYHLEQPQLALDSMASLCSELLLIETCVSYKDIGTVNLTGENQACASQAFTGTGCRPTRPWLFNELKKRFQFVYVPITQPWHEEFPIDWHAAEPPHSVSNLTRAIFIGARRQIVSTLLVEYIPMNQRRC